MRKSSKKAAIELSPIPLNNCLALADWRWCLCLVDRTKKVQMWFYGRNYRDASKVGTGTVVFKHALLSWYKLPRHKEKHRRRKNGGIRGRITAVLPVLLLLRSWETAGGEKRSSHMWELVRELSQVQRLRVSLAYFSQAQSAVERLFVWLFPRGYPQRGTLQIQTAWACRRERRAGRMVSYEGCVDWLSSHTEISTQLLSRSQLRSQLLIV